MTKKLWLLALLLVLVPLLAGCFGGAAAPLPIDQVYSLRDQFEELDRANRQTIDEKLTAWKQEADAAAQSKDRAVQQEALKTRLLIAYCWERRGDFPDAETNYALAGRGPYSSIAQFRIVQIAQHRAAQAQAEAQNLQAGAEARDEAALIATSENAKALKALEQVYNSPPGAKTLLRNPSVASLPLQSWQVSNIRYEAYKRLDTYYRSRPFHKAMAFFVRLCGGASEAAGRAKKSYPYILAIILMAIIARLITAPLSGMQIRSMKAMQAVQPELKKLQEKYKDDKQQMARAQMELFKEHKVNPASSCLPLLIQFPILILVYWAIHDYVFQFEGVHFLYIKSLADPDILPVGVGPWPGPLLVLYGVSMYFSQKLLAQPSATPEQQQQQKMMAYMMPVILLFLLKTLPAAFILYWLLQNILMTGHQWLIMRPQKVLVEVAATRVTPTPTKPGAPAGPPPEAIRKLSQGSQSTKKKRRRR